jgi:hypothetical protein
MERLGARDAGEADARRVVVGDCSLMRLSAARARPVRFPQ